MCPVFLENQKPIPFIGGNKLFKNITRQILNFVLES